MKPSKTARLPMVYRAELQSLFPGPRRPPVARPSFVKGSKIF
jgi:hypothetical protein